VAWRTAQGRGVSELAPVGSALVTAQAGDLTPGARAQELRERHEAVQKTFKDHRDAEQLALQMAWLCLIAIEVVRQMEESHVGSDRDRDVPGDPRLGPRPAQRPSGGWANLSAPGKPSSPVRPH
jgi:hypothetical protein